MAAVYIVVPGNLDQGIKWRNKIACIFLLAIGSSYSGTSSFVSPKAFSRV
jgi:hypothetical protein